MCPGAASSPHSPVNTTRLITRGLVSAKKSRHSAGSAWVWTVAIMSLFPLPLAGGVRGGSMREWTRPPPAPPASGRGVSVRGRRRSRADRVVVRVVVLDHRQRLELVVRRRARQRPFERRRALAPVV